MYYVYVISSIQVGPRKAQASLSVLLVCVCVCVRGGLACVRACVY